MPLHSGADDSGNKHQQAVGDRKVHGRHAVRFVCLHAVHGACARLHVVNGIVGLMRHVVRNMHPDMSIMGKLKQEAHVQELTCVCLKMGT